jgi:hypothetical protein
MDLRLQTLKNRLLQHDWWHMMSDDHSVWYKGNTDLMEIKKLVKGLGGDGVELFNAYAPPEFEIRE